MPSYFPLFVLVLIAFFQLRFCTLEAVSGRGGIRKRGKRWLCMTKMSAWAGQRWRSPGGSRPGSLWFVAGVTILRCTRLVKFCRRLRRGCVFLLSASP